MLEHRSLATPVPATPATGVFPVSSEATDDRRFVAEFAMVGDWGEEQEALLAEVATRLTPHVDEIARVWAERLLVHLQLPSAAQFLEILTSLNRWFLVDHLHRLQQRDFEGAFRKNFENNLELLRSQRAGDPELRSTLLQLYLSLEISTTVILEWVEKLYAHDPRLPRLIAIHGRFALHLGKIVGEAFYLVRSEELQEALRVASALQEASRALNTRAASVAGVHASLAAIACGLLRSECSLTFSWDEAEGAYVAAQGEGFSDAEMTEIRAYRFPPGKYPVTDSLLAGQATSGPYDDGQCAREPMERYGLNVYAVAPIVGSDGRPLGVLSTYRRRAAPFNAMDLQILTSIAQNAGLAIENATLIEQLEAAARLKSEFINSMSHEIRTPLNILFGYLDMMVERHQHAPEDHEILERMRRNAGYVLTLVNTILDIGRVESGRMPLTVSRFAIDELVAELQEMFEPLTRTRAIEFVCQADPDVPPLTTDRLKLLEILNNLVNNAFKFTARGTVGLRVSRCPDGDQVRFEVSDTGIGVDASEIGVIFDLFRQASNTDRGGTGLGLYIVKRLTDLLGGDVGVESEPGEGSTFHVTIPAVISRGPKIGDVDIIRTIPARGVADCRDDS